MRGGIRGNLHRVLLRNLRVGVPVYAAMSLVNRRHGHRRLLQHLKGLGLSPRTILDVGANRAEWSGHAAGVFPGARFHLFEPLEEYHGIIGHFLDRRPGSVLHGAVAGSRDGTERIVVHQDMVGSSTMIPRGQSQRHGYEVREVPSITVDSALRTVGGETPELVKIDVQGSELEVLRGARTCLEGTRVFIVECSLIRFYPRQAVLMEVLSFMGEQGYVPYDIVDPKHRPLDGALAQVDVCFVKEEDPLRGERVWGE